MQKKFQILLMVCCNPNLLILDEPTANLDSVPKNPLLTNLGNMLSVSEKHLLAMRD